MDKLFLKKGNYDYFVYKPLIQRFIKTILTKFGKNILGCILFGSVARGQASNISDIDLLILVSTEVKSRRNEFIKLLVKIDDCEERRKLLKKGIYSYISAILKTEEELIEDPLILLDILNHGIIIYDPHKKLFDLLRRLRKKLKMIGAKHIEFEDGSWAWDLKPDWKPGEVVEIKL